MQFSAPGIDVVLTGEPEKVHSLLTIVRQELERTPRQRRRRAAAMEAHSESQIVRPTELDEMDSPYALPEAMVMAVEEATDGGEQAGPKAAILPVSKAHDSEEYTKPHVQSRTTEPTPVAEATAVSHDPRRVRSASGEYVSEGDVVAVHDARHPSGEFHSDAGPTLLADGSSDLDSEPPPDAVHVFTKT